MRHMTVWNIHFLSARNELVDVMSGLRAAARKAVAGVRQHADLPRFDLVVRAGRDVAPDWGMSADLPAAGVIHLTLNPERFDEALVIRSLTRKLHQVIRRDLVGQDRSLGDALVSEGLAGHFVLQVLGGQPDPWDRTTLTSGVARKAMNEWSRPDFDQPRWFLGKGDIRKWGGYALGHKLIAQHLAMDPGKDAVSLAGLRADAFRPTMRKLVNEDGPAPQDDPEADRPTEPAASVGEG